MHVWQPRLGGRTAAKGSISYMVPIAQPVTEAFPFSRCPV